MALSPNDFMNLRVSNDFGPRLTRSPANQSVSLVGEKFIILSSSCSSVKQP